jgi:RND family efflux transporter MFP subunit
MKKNRTTLTTLLLCLISFGCAPRNQFQPPPPPQVGVEAPEIQDITVYQEMSGRVEAMETVEIRARVPGFLEKVAFSDGAKVKEGQHLFTIEQATYQAAVHAAEAGLKQAEAGLALAQSSLQRKEKAFANKAVSELDVLTAQADVQSAEASVQTAKANLEQANLNLGYTTITAPINGRISRSYISEGNMVGSGSPTLLALVVSEDPIYAYFSVDERRLLPILRDFIENGGKRGEDKPTVKLAMADGVEYGLEGDIDYIDNTLEVSTGTLMVRAVFKNPDSVLLPGMYGKVLLPRAIPNAMLIPEICIQRDLAGSFVLTLGDDGTVESVYVELGPRYEDRRVVTKGLDPGSRVIVKGLQRVRPGIKAQAGSAGTPTGKEG